MQLTLSKRQRIPKGQYKMDNPEKLATWGIQDEEKQSKNTTQYVLDTTIHKQTQITYTSNEPSYKQLKVKTTRTSFPRGNRNGHHNTGPRTQRHIIGQHKKTKKMSNTDPTKNPGVNSGVREA